jgi:hypothetical protein
MTLNLFLFYYLEHIVELIPLLLSGAYDDELIRLLLSGAYDDELIPLLLSGAYDVELILVLNIAGEKFSLNVKH